MFRDPAQLNVHQLADALALRLVRDLAERPPSPIGCVLASAAIRPALRIQEACRRPGRGGFAEGLGLAAETAMELHYLCGLGVRAALLAAEAEQEALRLVKALLRLRKVQRERDGAAAATAVAK